MKRSEDPVAYYAAQIDEILLERGSVMREFLLKKLVITTYFEGRQDGAEDLGARVVARLDEKLEQIKAQT